MDYIAIYYYDSSTIFYIDDNSDELKTLDKLKIYNIKKTYNI